MSTMPLDPATSPLVQAILERAREQMQAQQPAQIAPPYRPRVTPMQPAPPGLKPHLLPEAPPGRFNRLPKYFLVPPWAPKFEMPQTQPYEPGSWI